MKEKTFYITTPIYYPSGKLHIGHSYTTVAADTMARFKRLQGFDVMFLTGTDEHGQKIEDKAREAGKTPKQYVDDIVAGIIELWKLMNISNDKFIRTTDPAHEKAVQMIFAKLYEKGDIYLGKYSGMYCKTCEAFWTETQLDGDKCPECGADVAKAQEDAYFFRLSSYAGKLMKYYEKHPEFIEPGSRLNEMVNNFIRPGLEDLCVSRTSFKWGVPVSFDKKHVVYVWIDALSNYITALGYGGEDDSLYKKYWPADVHLVGKEIVRFHTIIWPAMLMALGEPLPKKVFGHGWLLLEGGKMSKSKGNVVDPVILCGRYGVDAVRYFLLREIPFGSDGVFSNEALINRINADLANDLGNLLSRTVAMADRYFGGTVPAERAFEDIDDSLGQLCVSTKASVEEYLENLQFSNALTELWKLISRTNKFIDETAPWQLAKKKDAMPRLAGVLYCLCESLRIISVLLSPFMPETAGKIRRQLGLGASPDTWDEAGVWGLYPGGTKMNKGDIIFPRIDALKELEALGEAAAPKPEPVPERLEGTAALVDIEDFAKISLTVAEVIACEPVPRAKKLLKLTLDDASGSPRTVVSGIAPWYQPEELTGRKIILVANLKPAVICSVESRGMILAADCPDGTVKVLFADDLPAGARIR